MRVSSLVFKRRAIGMLVVAVMAAHSSIAPARAGTLYVDLGEERGLTRIVDGLLQRALADTRVMATLEDTNIERLKKLLVLQLCGLAGGPCHYTGRTMKAAHADLNLAPRHFNALVEDLQDAMDAEHVSFWTQNRLLALLAPMHRDVVGGHAGTKPGATP